MKKRFLIILLALVLAGAGYSYYQQQTVPLPAMQECLGRLTFAVPAGLHWGMGKPSVPMSFRAKISRGLTTSYDTWEYNKNLLVMTSHETEKINFDDQWERFKAFDRHKMEADKKIELLKEMLSDNIKAQQKQKQRLANGEKILETKLITEKGIKRRRDALEEAVQARAKLDEPVPVHQLSVPDAYTVTFDTQWAYAWRQNRIYLFYFSNRSIIENYNTATDGVPQSEVEQTLQRFRPRQLGELPSSPAFCYPYGSINDEGKVGYEIKNSFYFDDEPNVIYSIYTGTYRNYPSSNVANQGLKEPVMNYGKQGKQYEQHTVTESFTLGSGEKITLHGQLSMRKPDVTTGEPYAYILTGETDSTDPFIGIQVISLIQDPEDGRPNHAPPLEQTLKRLKPILKSMKVTLDGQMVKD